MHYILTIIVLAAAWVSTPVSAQDNATATVEFISEPWGAEVILNGKPIGLSPLTINVVSGKYTVSFLLPGFREWTDEVVLHTPRSRVFARLQGGDNFTRLPYAPASPTWAPDSNQLRFLPFRGENAMNGFVTYDLHSGAIKHNTFPFGWLEDSAIRQQLNIAGNKEETIVAYQSPSGRYIAFSQKTDTTDWLGNANWVLEIFDRESGEILDTLIPVNGTIIDSTEPSFQLLWSVDETVLGLMPSDAPGALFCVFLDGNQPKTTLLRSFTSDTGEEVYIEEVVSSPSNQGQVFVFNQVSPPEFPTSDLWLVNCASLTGTRVPIEGAFDAVFSPTDQETIIIAHKKGISRSGINNLDQSELITDIVSDRWGVFRVDLSSTAEYALVYAGDAFTTTYWIYRLP